MWTKEYYQETLLGYLGFVQTQIEALERSRVKRGDITELYADIDTALERLWRIIRASDTDWEAYRCLSEESCEQLLFALSRVQLHALKRQKSQGVEVHRSKWMPLGVHPGKTLHLP